MDAIIPHIRANTIDLNLAYRMTLLNNKGNVSNLNIVYPKLHITNNKSHCQFILNTALQKYNISLQEFNCWVNENIVAPNTMDPTNFDYKFYLEKYPDLRHLNKSDAYNHFINHGIKE